MKNSSLQQIVFIGAGNVAAFLSETLKDKRDIIQVYSRTLASAKKLGQKIGCSYTNDLKKISQEADLYIIAVKDDAIAEVCKKLKLPGKTVVHTSGSVNMDVLKSTSDKYGVIWPLYSFTNKTVSGVKSIDKVKIPFFIEASDRETENELTALVKDINGKPYYLNSEKRAIIHLGAVFVNNFPNHLFTIAESLSKDAGIPFNVFLPIALETLKNLTSQSPSLSQTGPASRNDKKIVNKHIDLLKPYPVYKEVYKVLTKSIMSQRKLPGQTQDGKKEL